jgi:hypothetical protein
MPWQLRPHIAGDPAGEPLTIRSAQRTAPLSIQTLLRNDRQCGSRYTHQKEEHYRVEVTNASITFHTNDEDKDDDTHVTVIVRDSSNVLAANVANDFGHFNDHSDNGPFELIVRNPSERADLQRGSVKIRIDPNGNDTWRFNFDLDLQFDDDTHLSGEAQGLELTQDRQEQTFGLEGILALGSAAG